MCRRLQGGGAEPQARIFLVLPRTTPERVSQVTILFRPAGGGTDLEFRHEQFFDEAARDGHQRGWSETFVKLEQFLGGETTS